MIVTHFSNLYDQTKCSISVNDKESRWFSIKTGVKQSCVATPDLFNCCVVNYIMTEVCQRITGVRLHNYHLADEEYADDTTLFSDPVTDIIAGINIFQEEVSKLVSKASGEKSKLIHVGDGANLPSIAIESTITNFMDSFINLRSSIPTQVISAKRLMICSKWMILNISGLTGSVTED